MPKDRVVVLSPVYGPFFTTVKLHGREVADCPLRLVEGRYEMDWQAIEQALADRTNSCSYVIHKTQAGAFGRHPN